MESRIRFVVDAAHCERASAALTQILRSRAEFRAKQRYAAWWNPRLAKWARIFALVTAVFGLAVTLSLRLFDTSDWARPPSAWFIPVFSAFIVFMLLQPRLEGPLRDWSFRVASLGIGRTVARVMREASRLAPFEADYELKGDLMVYCRGKDANWRLGWSRNLGKIRPGGHAVQAESLTVLFRKPTSVLPWAVILQQGREWPAAVMQELGIAVDPPA